MSDCIKAMEKIVTAMTNAIGAISFGGSSMTAWASTPKATANIIPSVIATPRAMPEAEKREARVTIGIANQDIVGTLAAMITWAPTQAAKIAYSGLSRRSIWESATLNTTAAIATGSTVHQP